MVRCGREGPVVVREGSGSGCLALPLSDGSHASVRSEARSVIELRASRWSTWSDRMRRQSAPVMTLPIRYISEIERLRYVNANETFTRAVFFLF